MAVACQEGIRNSTTYGKSKYFKITFAFFSVRNTWKVSHYLKTFAWKKGSFLVKDCENIRGRFWEVHMYLEVTYFLHIMTYDLGLVAYFWTLRIATARLCSWITYFNSECRTVGAIQTEKTKLLVIKNNVIYFKNKTMSIRNFSVKFWHLLSNTKVDLEDRVAYMKKRVVRCFLISITTLCRF